MTFSISSRTFTLTRRIARAAATPSWRRTFSSVDLEYTPVLPANGNDTEGPLVILHGLFGSRKNWSSLSKAFAKDLDRPVYCLDLRNHGTSPHAEPMDYTAMAEDVARFIRQKNLRDVSLLGHSMGGKVAMTLALSSPESLERLIVADIAPSKGKLSSEFQDYVVAMKKIEAAGVGSRKEAQAILHEYEKDPGVAAFLLTNLVLSSSSPAKFRIPVDLIGRSVDNLGDFPYQPGTKRWEGPTMFIKGSRSPFINRHNQHLLKEYFPGSMLEMLDATHWVHAERPDEFKKLVCEFVA